MNSQKNRNVEPSQFEAWHFDDLSELAVPAGVSKKHRSGWLASVRAAVGQKEKHAVRVTGYLIAVKLEGPESPNCHSDNDDERDYHLWLANSQGDEKADAIVVEITPRIRATHPSWNAGTLSKLAHDRERVRVAGLILMDPEHPDQVGKTRATLWEIHPVMQLDALRNGA